VPAPESGTTGDGGGQADSPATVTDTGSTAEEAAAPPCKLNEPFETPKPFEPLNSDEDEGTVRFSADGMTAYFTRGDFGSGQTDIWVAAGPTFANPVLLANVNGVYNAAPCCSDDFASVSPDHTEIFTYRNDTSTGTIKRASRTLVSQGFGGQAPVPGLEAYTLIEPHLSVDGNTLYVADVGAGLKLKQSQRVTGFQFNAPVEVFSKVAYGFAVSKDERTLYYYDSGPKVATRADKSATFANAAPVTELEAYGAVPSYVTPDACRLYFTSGSSGAGKAKNNIWYADKPK
jgi:hypothetical protein